MHRTAFTSGLHHLLMLRMSQPLGYLLIAANHNEIACCVVCISVIRYGGGSSLQLFVVTMIFIFYVGHFICGQPFTDGQEC